MTFFFNNNETGTGLTRKGHAGSCFVYLFALLCQIDGLAAFCGYLPGVIVLYDDLWTQIRIKSGLITDQLRQECIHMHTVIFCGFSDVHNKFLPYFIYCLRAVR